MMIFFTGDINLTDNAFDVGFGVGTRIKKGYNPFSGLPKSDEDIWIGNFEGVVADTSSKFGYAKDSFRIDSTALFSSESIIDYWGISNNHVMEHGRDAYNEMEDILSKYGKGVFGSNKKKYITFEHQKKHISVVGFNWRVEEHGHGSCDWNMPELIDIKQVYSEICHSDYKIAYIHWGVEYINYPSNDQRFLGHCLIDLGFDLVVGMHPHVLQGYEVYKDKYIFYSLGNCVFHMPYTPTKYGALATLDIETGAVGYKYLKINEEYMPHLIPEDEMPAQYKFENLNKLVNKQIKIEKYTEEFRKNLKKYRKANRREIFKNAFRFDLRVLVKMIFEFIKRKL